MEKISGIIPASARTQMADTSVAQPARPGAPAMGRPMGKNSLGDRVTLSKELEEFKRTSMAEPLTPEAGVYKNPVEARKMKVIDDLNKKFFSNPKVETREGDTTKSEDLVKATQAPEGLFFVEKSLKPPSDPIKETTDNKVV